MEYGNVEECIGDNDVRHVRQSNRKRGPPRWLYEEICYMKYQKLIKKGKKEGMTKAGPAVGGKEKVRVAKGVAAKGLASFKGGSSKGETSKGANGRANKKGLKPRVTGCRWISGNHGQGCDQYSELDNFKAIALTSIPIATSYVKEESPDVNTMAATEQSSEDTQVPSVMNRFSSRAPFFELSTPEASGDSKSSQELLLRSIADNMTRIEQRLEALSARPLSLNQEDFQRLEQRLEAICARLRPLHHEDFQRLEDGVMARIKEILSKQTETLLSSLSSILTNKFDLFERLMGPLRRLGRLLE